MSRTTIADRGPMKCCMCRKVLAGAPLDCVANGCDYADRPESDRASEATAVPPVPTEFVGGLPPNPDSATPKHVRPVHAIGD